jgi:hypothetical protein
MTIYGSFSAAKDGNGENDVGAKNLSPPRMNIIVNQKKGRKIFRPYT